MNLLITKCMDKTRQTLTKETQLRPIFPQFWIFLKFTLCPHLGDTGMVYYRQCPNLADFMFSLPPMILKQKYLLNK